MTAELEAIERQRELEEQARKAAALAAEQERLRLAAEAAEREEAEKARIAAEQARIAGPCN